uniref:Ig-like domain-containing protein n=1 Tax=Anser brachyrhynchus TaxID=132585 RepID=A0A8B9BIG0_9AVES
MPASEQSALTSECEDPQFFIPVSPLVQEESDKSCSFEFQATETPPKFLRLISDYSTFVGASACFQCLVTGSPYPSVHWYKDEMLLEGDRYLFAGNDHSLILPYVGMQDEGKYTCMASNVHGEAACSAHLHVRQDGGRGQERPQELQLSKYYADLF